MYFWQHADGGNVPQNAAAIGQEADGTPLFAARAQTTDGGLQLGKVRPGFGHALIPFGGQELPAEAYEVLMGNTAGSFQWHPASGGHVPMGAVAVGQEADGEALFLARAFFNGGTHPGKVRRGFNGANIGFGGQEKMVPNYEVLCEA